MMNTTNLSDATCSDELLGDLVDEDPRFGALWLYILAASQPWGRFPANVKLFKARVCPMVDTLTGATLQELVERLIAVGMLTRYVCPWTGSDCIAVVNHGRYNGTGRKYHRMGKPEFGPHPGWEPPEQLVAYLRYVAGGRYESKTLEGESEKFGIDPGLVRDESVQSDSDSGTTDSIRDNAPGLVRDESGINPPRTEDGGLRTEEYNDEGRQDDSANAGFALASPRASRNGKRRTADGKHRTADGKRPAARASPPKQEPELTPRETWEAMHGPLPDTLPDQGFWLEAMKRWMRGEEGPFLEYEFPPPLPPEQQTKPEKGA